MTLSASKYLPLSCVLNSLTVKPALEKHLLEEADATGMQTYLKQVASSEEVTNLWTIISCVQLQKKFEFWRAPFCGGFPILVSPNFVKFYFPVMFTYLKNFMCLIKKLKSLNFVEPV